ncbi:hypothetical protein LguiA_030138 [Lonicera macranthoides]
MFPLLLAAQTQPAISAHALGSGVGFSMILYSLHNYSILLDQSVHIFFLDGSSICLLEASCWWDSFSFGSRPFFQEDCTESDAAENCGRFPPFSSILSCPRNKIRQSCSLYFVMYEHTAYVIELDYPSKNPYDSAWVIYLWNPSARQSRRLPSPGINLQFACQVKFGFGYNESIVVGIFGVFDDWGSYDTEVKAFTNVADPRFAFPSHAPPPMSTPSPSQTTPPTPSPYNHAPPGPPPLCTGGKKRRSSEYRTIVYSLNVHISFRTCDTRWVWVLLHHHSRYLSSPSILDEASLALATLDYPLKNPNDSVWIVGSCNGLLCLAIEGDPIFLWNPSTIESRRLLNPVKVYSTRRDSWKRIQAVPYAFPLDNSDKGCNLVMEKECGVRESWIGLNCLPFCIEQIELHNFVPVLEVHAYVESVVSPNIHPGPERQQR